MLQKQIQKHLDKCNSLLKKDKKEIGLIRSILSCINIELERITDEKQLQYFWMEYLKIQKNVSILCKDSSGIKTYDNLIKKAE